MKRIKHFHFIMAMIVAIFLISCKSEESEWNKVKQSDNKSDANVFIKNYPEGKYIKDAKAMFELTNIPFPIVYTIDSIHIQGLSRVSSGDYNANEISSGSFSLNGIIKSIKIRDITIEVTDTKIVNGIIKTKEFGDFTVLFSFEQPNYRTNVNQFQINKIKKILKL